MKAIIGATIALTLLGSSAAFAQSAYRSQQPQIEVQNRNSAEPRNQNSFGQSQERNDQASRSNEVRDNPHWSRGDKLPAQYRSNQYVVSDWKANRLRKPPRGYHWVRANNQYVLAALASGVIADIIMDTQHTR
jgi:Ni/Co efflux regulator RcnB